jgi:hypothetical protein
MSSRTETLIKNPPGHADPVGMQGVEEILYLFRARLFFEGSSGNPKNGFCVWYARGQRFDPAILHTLKPQWTT